jgi:hypothetical protein
MQFVWQLAKGQGNRQQRLAQVNNMSGVFLPDVLQVLRTSSLRRHCGPSPLYNQALVRYLL